MRKLRALVVDDSKLSRSLLMKAVRKSELADVEFEQASDGEQALRKFEANPHDILFLDWNMPGLKGVDVVRRVRALPNGSETLLVMVTSECTDDKRAEADEAGANGFIVKPYTEQSFKGQLIGDVGGQLKPDSCSRDANRGTESRSNGAPQAQ